MTVIFRLTPDLARISTSFKICTFYFWNVKLSPSKDDISKSTSVSKKNSAIGTRVWDYAAFEKKDTLALETTRQFNRFNQSLYKSCIIVYWCEVCTLLTRTRKCCSRERLHININNFHVTFLLLIIIRNLGLGMRMP